MYLFGFTDIETLANRLESSLMGAIRQGRMLFCTETTEVPCCDDFYVVCNIISRAVIKLKYSPSSNMILIFSFLLCQILYDYLIVFVDYFYLNFNTIYRSFISSLEKVIYNFIRRVSIIRISKITRKNFTFRFD